MDDLGLEQTDHGLGQGIVIAVSDAGDGGLDAGVSQAFSVLDRHVLAAAIRVVNQPIITGWTSFMQRLFQDVEDELCLPRP